MAVHSSTLAWKIPWTEEPGGLQSMGFSRQEYWSGRKYIKKVIRIVRKDVCHLAAYLKNQEKKAKYSITGKIIKPY